MAQVQLDRENTNFSLELARKLATLKWPPQYNCLYYHQNIAREYFRQEFVRGTLFYHGTGMGKSILAASIIFDAMFPPRDAQGHIVRGRKVIILLAKSLAHNMIEAMDTYLDMRADANIETPEHSEFGAILMLPRDERRKWLREMMQRDVRFVTMNASNMMTQMERVSNSMDERDEDLIIDARADAIIARTTKLDNHLLVIDEAHGLFRAIINGSRNAAELYQRIMAAKNLKLVFLTGTPIASDPFEMAVCFNMLSGKQIFPVQYTDFHQMFVAPNEVNMRNKHIFQNRIMGLVSHVTSSSQVGAGVGEIVAAIRANESALAIDTGATAPRESDYVHVEFPEEYPLEIVRVPMDAEQFNAYISARETERSEGMRKAEAMMGGRSAVSRKGRAKMMQLHKWRAPETPALQKPKSEFSSTYRVHSRQIGNYCPPADIRRAMYEITQEGGTYDTRELLDKIGDIDSAKFRAILDNVRKHNGQLGIIYSQFVGIGGLAVLARFLDQNGYKDKWALISGEVDPADRARIIERFCAPSNAHGEDISLLLISATGAEGIDLKNVRHVHILEPYWNYGRIQQVKARAIRNGSHIDLPADERNVRTFLYIAVPPKYDNDELQIHETQGVSPDESDKEQAAARKRAKQELTSDEELYENSRKGQLLIEEFERAMREISIECPLNHAPTDLSANCRMCAPTSAPLFSESIAQDAVETDPCRPIISHKIRAKKITVNGSDYYWRDAPRGSIEERAYGYELFILDEALRAWRKIAPNDPVYEVVAEAIRQSK